MDTPAPHTDFGGDMLILTQIDGPRLPSTATSPYGVKGADVICLREEDRRNKGSRRRQNTDNKVVDGTMRQSQ